MRAAGYHCNGEEAAGTKLPIAKTQEIGHGNDAKAIRIGEKIYCGGDEACRSVVTDAERRQLETR